MNLRLISSFCFFLLIVCPLTASAACPPGGDTEIIESTASYTLTNPEFSISICNKIDQQKTLNVSGLPGKYSSSFKSGAIHINIINEKPQCQPVGELPRQCVDHEIVSAFPIGNGCAIEWEFTVCAYTPIADMQGINDDIAVPKKPATRQRGPRSRRGR